MPALSFFADDQDVTRLVDRLNADPEIAFIIPHGPLDPEQAYVDRLRAAAGERTEVTYYLTAVVPDSGYRQRWRAVPTVAGLKDGKHSLWHIPTGPLPLLTSDGRDQVIADPYAGWTEQSPGADSLAPYFGPGHLAEIRLELWTRHRPYSEAEKASLSMLDARWDGDHDVLSVSDFQWIGNHYGPAPRSSWRWWKRLEAWLTETSTPIGEKSWAFWAFPSALAKLKKGMTYYARGWELDEAIRTADLPPA